MNKADRIIIPAKEAKPMELDLNEFGKRYVTYTTYLFNAILFFGAVFIFLVFAFPGETVGNIFLATQFLSGTLIFFLPVAIVLAIIKRTRKIGGATLYTIAAISIACWWLAGLMLLLDKGGVWWAVVGIVSSLFTSGLGLFFVTVISAIIHKSLYGILLFIGIPLICRGVMNFSKSLMEIQPEQVKKKIEEFEKHQQIERDERDEKIKRIETDLMEKEEEIEELDEILREIDGIEHYYADDEQYDDQDKSDYEQNVEAKIARLRHEISENDERRAILQESVRTAQIKEAEARDNFIRHIKELAGGDKSGHELLMGMYLETELPEGTKESIEQAAHRLWKQGEKNAALECFNLALAERREEITDSDDAITLVNRGNLQLELGNFEEGKLDLERAAQINPTLPTWNLQLLELFPPEDPEGLRQSIFRKDEDNE